MTIHIESLTFDAIIGLLDFEREHPQRVTVDLTLSYPYSNKNFIDYAKLAEEIETKVKSSHFMLLEEALESIERMITVSYPQVVSLMLKIGKPDILHNATVALSSSWHYPQPDEKV
ncbi:Dihydroneopterin aldolase [hydrothermal vent metagenome]|uniref:Dihydroneopterin aldolase n=1 Tax=hydrothermal vent metagenome TaxID=652676 RepID=A0A1W1EA96_9ZZZZ